MKNILMIFMLLILNACSDSDSLINTSNVRTISFYMENKEVMKETVAFCNESEDRKKTPNCMNAISAESQTEFDDFTAIPDELR